MRQHEAVGLRRRKGKKEWLIGEVDEEMKK